MNDDFTGAAAAWAAIACIAFVGILILAAALVLL